MADILTIIHLLFIAFAVLGGLLVLRWRRVMALHIPAAIWAALVDLADWRCPLTGWENAALRRAGKPGYSGDFVAHYLLRWIYPAGLTRTMEIVLASIVIAINATVYAIVIGRIARRRGAPAADRA